MGQLTQEEIMKYTTGIYENVCSMNWCETCPIKRLLSDDRINRIVNNNDCEIAFKKILDVGIRAQIATDGKPVKQEPPAKQRPVKPALPKWCKVGAWVTPKDKMAPMRITNADVSGAISARAEDGTCDIGLPSDFRPVRFRFPTLEEAYEWLGKVMAHRSGRREIVSIVNEDEVTGSEDDALNGKMLFINGCPAENLFGCTIDGYPFGVPEIDTDAEKEETK